MMKNIFVWWIITRFNIKFSYVLVGILSRAANVLVLHCYKRYNFLESKWKTILWEFIQIQVNKEPHQLCD